MRKHQPREDFGKEGAADAKVLGVREFGELL